MSAKKASPLTSRERKAPWRSDPGKAPGAIVRQKVNLAVLRADAQEGVEEGKGAGDADTHQHELEIEILALLVPELCRSFFESWWRAALFLRENIGRSDA